MATQDDVRRIALSLPDVSEGEGSFGFSVLNRGKQKGIAWVWLERIHPKKARVPCPEVLAVRVPDDVAKQLYLSSDPVKFFTEPHYNGYPAILVRLSAIEPDELEELLIDAWRCMAPEKLVAEYESSLVHTPTTSPTPFS